MREVMEVLCTAAVEILIGEYRGDWERGTAGGEQIATRWK